eukprot:NODE_7477_length_589_cov_63.272727_g7454_i0.p2 GENE.NODE_7477_length_589_cov_63.272727_g7454_i0~~NODE_7477_length_589_cov_63.272727_g7454_i0.p2  ORF type:complete len:144 (-),score=39.41 NODE_7477_length_589_cov_63.272727_g7454_i0:37-468(-)
MRSGGSLWDGASSKPKRQKVEKRVTPTEVKLSHILVRHQNSDKPYDRNGSVVTRTKGQAIAKVEDLKQKIVLNLDGGGIEGGLKKAAKKESDCPSYNKGGKLGTVKKGQLPKELEDAAFGLSVGELSNPVQTAQGVHLLLRHA